MSSRQSPLNVQQIIAIAKRKGYFEVQTGARASSAHRRIFSICL